MTTFPHLTNGNLVKRSPVFWNGDQQMPVGTLDLPDEVIALIEANWQSVEITPQVRSMVGRAGVDAGHELVGFDIQFVPATAARPIGYEIDGRIYAPEDVRVLTVVYPGSLAVLAGELPPADQSTPNSNHG